MSVLFFADHAIIFYLFLIIFNRKIIAFAIVCRFLPYDIENQAQLYIQRGAGYIYISS